MKTILDFLEELEEPYRSQAIKNTKIQQRGDVLGTHVTDLTGALFSAFDWADTSQGAKYWSHYLVLRNYPHLKGKI